MNPTDRRTFLKMAGVPAVAGAISLDLSKATAIAANNQHGSIRDVEHVVILMQENRSFDHYFGTLRGVRGYGDPRAVRLPSGDPVWNQPNGADKLLPFRPDVPDVGEMFLPDPPHGWNDTHAAWNGGRHDQFVPNKGIQTMTYHTRHDLPYQYALADAFTICDNYYCSLLGPTDPNRYHMWTGWVGNDGTGGGPVLANDEAGYDWSTYPERLERNGISWKVYQDRGVGLDQPGFWGWTEDPFIGNYGDNSLLYFHQYQNAQPGSPLADKAKTGTLVSTQGRSPERLFDQFRADVQSGALPQVSWIVAPEAYTEHPNWAPDFGAWYASQVVDILASNPDVWSKMALFITTTRRVASSITSSHRRRHARPPTESPPFRSTTRSFPAARASPQVRSASACGSRCSSSRRGRAGAGSTPRSSTTRHSSGSSKHGSQAESPISSSPTSRHGVARSAAT